MFIKIPLTSTFRPMKNEKNKKSYVKSVIQLQKWTKKAMQFWLRSQKSKKLTIQLSLHRNQVRIVSKSWKSCWNLRFYIEATNVDSNTEQTTKESEFAEENKLTEDGEAKDPAELEIIDPVHEQLTLDASLNEKNPTQQPEMSQDVEGGARGLVKLHFFHFRAACLVLNSFSSDRLHKVKKMKKTNQRVHHGRKRHW